MTKKFVALSESSKERYSSIIERLHKSGITLIEAQGKSDIDLRKSIAFKGKKASFDGFRRNLNAIRKDSSKREGTSNQALLKYSKFGYRGKGLIRVKAELNRTVGQTFSGMAYDVRQAYPKYSVKQSYKEVRRLLKVPKHDYVKLTQKERDILGDYGY